MPRRQRPCTNPRDALRSVRLNAIQQPRCCRSSEGLYLPLCACTCSQLPALLQLSGTTTTAHQRFLSTGPIAMMPLDAGRASLVWTLPVQQAAQMVAKHAWLRAPLSLTLVQAQLPPAELASHVNAAFRSGHEGTAVLPPLATDIEGKAVAVPLQLMQACGMQDSSVVLVGDAAHAVHPLAGQGLNLGLQDALSLVAHMSRAAAAGGAADDFVALQASYACPLPPLASRRSKAHQHCAGVREGAAARQCCLGLCHRFDRPLVCDSRVGRRCPARARDVVPQLRRAAQEANYFGCIWRRGKPSSKFGGVEVKR